MKSKIWLNHYDYNVPAQMNFPRVTIQDLLFHTVNMKPNRVAIDFMGSEISYYQLRNLVLRFANVLGETGIQKGDRVAIQLPNCPQYIIAYYAVLCLGGIVVNVNPIYSEKELKHCLDLTQPKLFITFNMILPLIKGVLVDSGLDHVMVTVVTDFLEDYEKSSPEKLELEEGWLHFSHMLDNCSSGKIPRVEIAYNDPAVIVFTGGTTGLPKGALLTHANFIASVISQNVWGDLLVKDIDPNKLSVLALLPFFHMGGNITGLNWGISNGGRIILVPRFDVEQVMAVVAKYDHISYFPAVPTIFTAVFNHPKAEELELDKKFVTVAAGGAPMPRDLIEKIKDLGVAYNEGWSATETTCLGTANPAFGLKKVGSIGIPHINVDIKLVDTEKGLEEVPPGEPGEIMIQSPTVMKGYWNNEEETRLQLKGGWLYTGDIATMDEDGYFYIVDRKKDMIIASGYNVYPRDIDEVLYQHPKIEEAVAIGVPDEYRGETVKAFVVLKKDQETTAEEIMEFCKGKLAAYKAPKEIEFRTDLPKSAIGKILRKILRDEEMKKQINKTG